MGRGRRWRLQPQLGDLGDPRGLAALIAQHLEWMAVRNYSPHTIYHRDKSLRSFQVWCDYRGVTRAAEVTKPIVERYQRWLFHYRKADGQPLTFRSQYLRLVDVKGFFKWLSRQNLILSNPASDLEMPRQGFHLPAVVLTPEEVEKVFAQVELGDPLGPARPGDARDALLDRDPPPGAAQPRALRRRPAAQDDARSARARARRTGSSRLGSGRWPGSTSTCRTRGRRCSVDPSETTLFLSNRGGPHRRTAGRRRRPRLRRRAGARQDRLLPPLPPHHGDPDARERSRPALHPADARPRHDQDHRGLYPRRDPQAPGDPRRDPPRGEARGAEDLAGRGRCGGRAEVLAALELEAAEEGERTTPAPATGGGRE